MTYAICLDGGGSGCRAVLLDLACDPERVKILARGKSGAANVARGFYIFFKHILEASQIAIDNSGIQGLEFADLNCVIGAAGVNIDTYQERLQNKLPFKESHVVSDAVTALHGALEHKEGLLVAIGTGSIFVSRYEGEIKFLGGWGYQLSDLHSGARLGRDLLEYALLAYDGFEEKTPMTEALMAKFNDSPSNLSDFGRRATPQDYGIYAPMLFDYAESGDEIAADILKNTIAELERTINAISPSEDSLVCMTGSLGRRYSDYFTYKFKKRLFEAYGTPLDGAVYLAKELYGGGLAGEASS